MKAYIEPYSPEMREEAVNLKLRPADVVEVKASFGMDVKKAIEESLDNSTVTWVVKYAQEIIAVLGVAQQDNMMGIPWLLGTEQLHSIKFRIIKYSPLIVERMLFIDGVECLTNFVSSGHTEAIKWLKWLGFTFISDKPIYLGGVEFIQFYKWKGGCS